VKEFTHNYGIIMKLSPLNIKKQEFGKKMKGYDTNEVSAFLERVAEDFEIMQKENEELKKELELANSRNAEFRKIEKNLQDTLLKAQETAARASESAKKQTSLMIKEAELKALQITERARLSANELRNAVESLKQEKEVLVAKLKAIVNSQISLIEKTFSEQEEPADMSKRIPAQAAVDIDINDIINKIS